MIIQVATSGHHKKRNPFFCRNDLGLKNQRIKYNLNIIIILSTKKDFERVRKTYIQARSKKAAYLPYPASLSYFINSKKTLWRGRSARFGVGLLDILDRLQDGMTENNQNFKIGNHL